MALINGPRGLAGEVIKLWWIYIVVVGLLLFAVYAFGTLVGFETRLLSRKSNRRAEELYDQYADPPANHRRSRNGHA